MKKNFEDVAYLEDSDFDFSEKTLSLSKGNNVLHTVYIWRNNCPYCEPVFGEYQEFAKSMKNDPNVLVCCIQADGERESEKKLGGRLREIVDGFKGFPTIVVYQQGKIKDTLRGDRTFENLKNFVKKNS